MRVWTSPQRAAGSGRRRKTAAATTIFAGLTNDLTCDWLLVAERLDVSGVVLHMSDRDAGTCLCVAATARAWDRVCRSLDMSTNLLNGTIPESLRSMTGLR
jgi:hypothetical protein